MVKDLLTHTAGLISGGLGTRVSVDIVRKPTDTLADYVPQLGKAALDFQPGTRWSYSATAGFEVLGYIIEKVTGKTLPVAFQERIFDPLQMNDTSFVVPDEQEGPAEPSLPPQCAGRLGHRRQRFRHGR